MNPWLSALIAVVAAVVVGSIAARVVRGTVAKAKNEAISSVASPIASLVFSVVLIFGLIVALGFVQPGALDTIPTDLVLFVPRAIAALIVVIGGNVVASLTKTTLQRVLRGTGAIERYVPGGLRAVILAFSAILAAAQLGIDTTIINILSAALLFGTAAAMAMLVGFGGRRVATEVAAGRAWRSSLRPGDRVRAANVNGVDIDGTVVEVHPTAIEVDEGGRTLLVPNSQLLNVVVERVRSSDAE